MKDQHLLNSISLCLIFIALGLICCSKTTNISEEFSSLDQIISLKNVPFIKQKDNFCGPATMASVMNFYGKNITQDEIAKDIYTPKLKGALISDMENFAREKDYDVQTTNGNIQELQSLIDGGVPPIVLVDLGKWVVSVPHYYVLYGYNKSTNKFLLHSGYKGNQEISFEKLDKQWEKMNSLVLVVRN